MLIILYFQCAKDNKMDWDSIDACATGEEGRKLLLEAGKKTKALRPKLSFVPTIVLSEVWIIIRWCICSYV